MPPVTIVCDLELTRNRDMSPDLTSWASAFLCLVAEGREVLSCYNSGIQKTTS